MSKRLLEKLEEEYQKNQDEIKEAEEEINRLEEEIELDEGLTVGAERKGLSKEDLEALEYEIAALKDIKTWKQSHLEEAEQEKRLLERKVNYCKRKGWVSKP